MVPFVATGARSWENPEPVRKVLTRLSGQYGYGRLVVIEGGAPGLDKVVREEAEAAGIHCMEIKALWHKTNRAAGPIRNKVMLGFNPRFVLGWHWDWEESKGTADCCNQAEELGIKTIRFTVPRRVAMPSAFDLMDAQAAKRAKKGKGKRT